MISTSDYTPILLDNLHRQRTVKLVSVDGFPLNKIQTKIKIRRRDKAGTKNEKPEELLTVRILQLTFSTCSIEVGEISTLAHELRDNSVHDVHSKDRTSYAKIDCIRTM